MYTIKIEIIFTHACCNFVYLFAPDVHLLQERLS